MKYIKQVTLENFQSHKHSILEFDEKLNVIVGSSDSGKSAIIRGIKWVLYNEPYGDYFIRENENQCSVTLKFNDNTVLKRYRSKSKNQYLLIKNNGEEMIFEGFGSNIPEEIIDEISIKKIYLDSSEYNSINLGEQLERPFLLSEKSSTRASAIGRLVGVNIVDDALREVLKDIRALNTTQKNLEENSIKLQKEIKEYDYLVELKESLNKIILLKDRITDNYARLEKYEKLYNLLKEINHKKEQLSYTLNKLTTISRLDENIKDIELKLFNYKYLNHRNTNLNKTKNEISKYSSISSKLESLPEYEGNILLLENKYVKHRQLKSLLSMKRSYNEEINRINYIINNVRKTDSVTNNIEKISISIRKIDKLNHYNNLYNNTINNMKIGELYISKFKGIESIDESILKLSNDLYMLTNLHKHYEYFITIKKNIKDVKDSINSIQLEINKQLDKYQYVLKKLEICPYCFSNIDKDKINHIISHYIGG